MILHDILHGIEALFLSQRVAVINKVKNFFVFTATQGPANISHILCHTGEWLGNQEEMIRIYNFLCLLFVPFPWKYPLIWILYFYLSYLLPNWFGWLWDS